MKHSQSSIFNNSQKTEYNFLKTGFSIINKSTSSPKKFNISLTAIKFPKIFLKLKNKNKKSTFLYNNSMENIKSKQKKELKDSFNILNFTKKETDKNSTILPNLRYSQNNTKENEIPNKSTPLLYNNFQNIKNKANNYLNYYDLIFSVKTKKTSYTKSLSSDYEKDNKNVIEYYNTRFKQKNDSILNVVRNNEGFYIKGLEYKKYYFTPHKKVNILAFHKNIMNNNIKHIKEMREMEIIRKRKEEEKRYRDKNRKTTYINKDDHFLNETFSRSRKRHWTKNYVIRKKMKKKIEEIVDEEFNNVYNSKKIN